jgi:4-amino-4-deoxy-L-arabinose transferase-like glycosyltransferase
VEALRSLSLLFAAAAVPVSWWAGRSLFGARAGWVAAVLAATAPYLSEQGREARMYSLLVVLGLVTVATFLHAFARRRRRWLPAFVASLVLVLYTHNWGPFLALGTAAAAGYCVLAGHDRRRALGDALAAFAAVALLYLPWVPTLLFQARHTGAPWARSPGGGSLAWALSTVLGGPWVALLLVVAIAAFGLDTARRQRTPESTVVKALVVVLVVTLSASWLSSQVVPAWSMRYFGIYLPMLLLLASVALASSARAGPAALAAVVVVSVVPWAGSPAEAVPKSNVEDLAATLAGRARAGDVVMSTQMEQVPLLRYYLGPDLRYADPAGLVSDPTAADWRDAFERMRKASPAEVLAPMVEDLPVGQHVLVFCPRLFTDGSDLLWYRLMDIHCRSARMALSADPAMALVAGPLPPMATTEPGASVFVVVYRKLGPP